MVGYSLEQKSLSLCAMESRPLCTCCCQRHGPLGLNAALTMYLKVEFSLICILQNFVGTCTCRLQSQPPFSRSRFYCFILQSRLRICLFNSDIVAFSQAEADLRVSQGEFDRQYEVTKLLLDGISTAHVSAIIQCGSMSISLSHRLESYLLTTVQLSVT